MTSQTAEAARASWTRRVTRLVLHLRARNVLVFVIGLAGIAVLTWRVGEWPVYDFGSSEQPWPFMLCMAPTLAAALAAVTMAGADEELERSTPWPWRLVRAMHVVAMAAVIATVLAVTCPWELDGYGGGELVRNTIASVGIVAAAMVVLGAKLAWAPLFTYMVTVYVIVSPPLTAGSSWWTWPVQPAGTPEAWWMALSWFAVGSAGYAIRGARATSDADA